MKFGDLFYYACQMVVGMACFMGCVMVLLFIAQVIHGVLFG